MAQQLAVKSKYQGDIRLTIDGMGQPIVDNMSFPNDEN
jgi:hypothetical protein